MTLVDDVMDKMIWSFNNFGSYSSWYLYKIIKPMYVQFGALRFPSGSVLSLVAL